MNDSAQPGQRWFIDLDWFHQRNRSFYVLAHGCLCPAHVKLRGRPREMPSDKLMNVIGDCCSKAQGFITDDLPILESVFRVFLSNGNQPLDVEKLSSQLNERRNSNRTSPAMLACLLATDQYYGLRQF